MMRTLLLRITIGLFAVLLLQLVSLTIGATFFLTSADDLPDKITMSTNGYIKIASIKGFVDIYTGRNSKKTLNLRISSLQNIENHGPNNDRADTTLFFTFSDSKSLTIVVPFRVITYQDIVKIFSSASDS